LGNAIANLGVSGGKPNRQLQINVRDIDPQSGIAETTDMLINSRCMGVCMDERIVARHHWKKDQLKAPIHI
jgi:hypothetical protein